MEGFGYLTLWGFTPWVDLVQFAPGGTDDLQLLVVGAGDVRHALRTLGPLRRHGRRAMVHSVEPAMELHARTMLLMLLATDPPSAIGLQEKTEMFLELFGNRYRPAAKEKNTEEK